LLEPYVLKLFWLVYVVVVVVVVVVEFSPLVLFLELSINSGFDGRKQKDFYIKIFVSTPVMTQLRSFCF
jgi:hypothetical protein